MSNIVKQRLAAGQSVSADHPAADLLSAFIERGLKEPERQRVLGHLASCAECRQAVALAASDVPAGDSAAPARGAMLRFPGAIRWASAAAMLAVAVGIGVISMEHQSQQRNAATTIPALVSNSSQKRAEAPKPESAGVQNAPVAGDQLTTASGGQKLAETKKTPSAEAGKKQAAAVVAARKSEDLNLNSRSFSNAAVSRETPAVLGGIAGQPQAEANALMAAAPPLPSSQNGNEAKKIVPPPPVSQSVTVVASAPTLQTADANERSTAKMKNAPQSASETVEVSSGAAAAPEAPALRSEAFSIPYNKSVGVPTLAGTVRRTTTAMTEFVSWSVTTAGKLQRQLRNGAVKLIEPAPGFLVRAVAAHGIEVWAGGSQPDLSAKHWRQAPALFHSSDAGETWTKVSGPWHGPINQLALVDSETLTVVTDDGTWTSHDAGTSWTTQ